MSNSAFLSDTFRYIPIHPIFLFFEPFYPFFGYLKVWIVYHSMDGFWAAFERRRFSEVKTASLENQASEEGLLQIPRLLPTLSDPKRTQAAQRAAATCFKSDSQNGVLPKYWLNQKINDRVLKMQNKS